MEQLQDALQSIVNEYRATAPVELTRPEPQFGDFACNVALKLAKETGKNPRDIAGEIATKLGEIPEVASAEVAGPGFINIRLSDAVLFELATLKSKIQNPKSTFPIVIETNNPNPFKAMHIGHALNAITADTIANLLDLTTSHLYRVSYHGDVGLHVGKCMYALLRYVDGQPERLLDVPEAEHNSFMSRMYAEGSRAYKDNDDAQSEISELARQSFTRTDPLYAQVYDTVFHWSFEQIDAVVARLGNKPVERRFLESDADVRGVKIVRDNVPKVFEESDGALVFKGSEHGSFDNVYVSSRGLGLYGARDLGLMQLKNEQYHPQKSYIVTAEEQRDYFKGVIAAAGLVWPERADQTVNISTGTLKLTTGKMSSRDGDVVEIAWLFDRVGEAVVARGGEPTEAVVAGALRYAFLKVRVGSDIVFDVNEAVSIQGNSGPYLQYAHARAYSILGKASEGSTDDHEETTSKIQNPKSKIYFDPAERALVRKIGEYNEVLERAVSELMPHHICTYLYELAQEFNRFYEHSRIIGDEREAVRLDITRLYRDTLARGLGVLGIVAPETM